MQARQDRAAPLSVIAPAPLIAAPAASRLGTRNPGVKLALPNGNIAGAVRALGVSLLKRTAKYEVLVANETTAPLATFAYPSGGIKRGRLMNWSAITVPPLSSIAVEIDIPFARRGPSQHLVAELHAPEAHLTVDGDPPKSLIDRARRTAFAGSAVILALGWGLYAAGKPRVAALAAPSSVSAGQPFTVAYAIAPNVDGEYTVETPDGHEVQRGALRVMSGAFDVTLPAGKPAGYDVRVVAHNLLGTDVRVAHVRAVMAPGKPLEFSSRIAKIASLALRSDEVHGGEPIKVDYAASSTTGGLKLLDQDGTVRAEAMTNSHGDSIMIAPHVDADQDFRVVMDIAQGTSTAEASVPVRILRDSPQQAGGHATVAESDVVAEDAAPKLPMRRSGPIAVPTVGIRSNGSIPVTILEHEKDLRVALSDEDGLELQSVAVGGNQGSIVLTAPPVTSPTKVTIAATFSRGVGQETVLSTVLVTPPAGARAVAGAGSTLIHSR